MEQNGLFLPFFTGQILLSDSPKNLPDKRKNANTSQKTKGICLLLFFFRPDLFRV